VRETVESGTLVRMHPTTGGAIRGRLTQPWTQSTTLVRVCRYPAPPCSGLSDTSAYQSISTSSLVNVEVQQGTHWASGAWIGGVFGGLFGALAGDFAWGMSDCFNCGGSQAAAIAGGALIGAVISAGFGALIGSSSPRWKPAR